MTSAPTKIIKLSSLKADLQREAAGDWIDFPDWPGVAFNVSSLHLPAYVTARDLAMKMLQKQYGSATVPQAVLTAELGRLYATHILHGWRGLDVPYSAADAMKTLSDPEFRNVVAAVEWCAAQVSQVQIQFVEVEAKNSAAPSATGSA
ncbi:hypothetical protein [Rhizobium sp. SGZ-381]|uniref:hypothetical protein n=1 Tax=Rhizobium sp. SGZ-381 TaxID=3342800 RepID=UPI00366E69E2